MFVIVTTYRARAGEEDAVIALHEDWQHDQKNSSMQGGQGHQSWRLLRKEGTVSEFISIAQFASEEIAQAAIQELKRDEWYRRLVSLMEEEPTQIFYTIVWQLS